MFALLRLLWVSLIVAAPAAAEPIADITAVVGADVLPMTDRERLLDQTVIVAGDRIIEVGPRRSVRIPAGAKRLDAHGMTLMPGLVDMHVHLAPVAGVDGDAAQRALAVMLAHGITTARGMAGSPANLQVRDAIERGRLTGPRFYVAAPGIHLQNADDADAAREKVRQAKADGYDLIKAHHIVDPGIWEAVQEEARKLGLPTAGHVTNPVGLARALAAGQQIEHLDGFVLALLPEGSPLRSVEFGQIPPSSIIQAAAAASDLRIAEIAAQAKGHHVPTLALFERITELERPVSVLLSHPDMRYVPDAALQQWSEQRGQMQKAGFTSSDGERFRALRQRITAALHRTGVPLMAGSDTAQSFHIWGPGLIQEIQSLGAAGLAPIDALRSATVVPRDYMRGLPNGGSGLGWKPEFGTVTKGARADLILLRRDPSRDLATLARPEIVIAAGRTFDRASLDAMLEKAALDAKAQPTAGATSKGPA
ncbi:amidohydrolase family protein [Allosphingosinicella indica]|uniref:Amidohydrolase family protein n=1 Tax=Allosphingosinicella indica TaxID=941907 RepID=A0A1X7FYJ4_9SPHN|nr:amidohydrolase family protein [Allosphingosinicella indica]SMF61123.1 Amidohydrolase family protein [Allosphingosinicella indica]